VYPSLHLKTEADPVFVNVVFSSYLEFWTMDKVHKPSDSKQSSARYVFMLLLLLFLLDIFFLAEDGDEAFSRISG
jgi:hypothetical protein